MMKKEIKSGKEILDEFFNELKKEEKLNSDTISTITELYNSAKLTDKNLTNALSNLRENNINGKD